VVSPPSRPIAWSLTGTTGSRYAFGAIVQCLCAPGLSFVAFASFVIFAIRACCETDLNQALGAGSCCNNESYDAQCDLEAVFLSAVDSS